MSDWQAEIREQLVAAGIGDAGVEAERILEAAGGYEERARERALSMVKRRIAGTPLEFVVGRVRFMGLEMLVQEGVLIPRQETEILARGAEERIRALGVEGELRIVDMCCGAGNLACALAVLFPRAKVWAADLTEACVDLARRNVMHFGLSDRVEVRQGDLFSGLEGLGLEGTIHALLCNPPYISKNRLGKDSAYLLSHEPVEAFDGGPYGLTIHQRVLKEGLVLLGRGALVGFEFGLGQEKQMELLFRRARDFGDVTFDKDAEGNPRAAFTRKKDI